MYDMTGFVLYKKTLRKDIENKIAGFQ